MRISLLCVGSTKDSEYIRLIEDYEQRLPSYLHYERIELAGVKNGGSKAVLESQKQEAANILKKINPSDFVVLLDENAKGLSSVQFAEFIQNQLNASVLHLCFVVGGPYGFHASVYDRANYKLALSQMTFTHQMVRLFFTEQLYRAMSIIENKAYHHG